MPTPFPTDTNQGPALANGTGDPIADSDGLLGQARSFQDQETAEITAAPADGQYSAALSEVIEEKQEQAAQIEGRLENMVEAQSARIQQVQSHPPGMLSLPTTRARWQAQISQAQATMQRLQNRLDIVREIRDGMAMHGPKIEAVAAQKLEYRQPELADAFAQTQVARREDEASQREKRWTAATQATEQRSASGGLSHGRGPAAG